MSRPRALVTIDLEDYRRQQLRVALGGAPPPHPDEVTRQLDLLLALLDDVAARALVFTVGRLARELPPRVWADLAAAGHRVGCHGDDHTRVDARGPGGFPEDLARALGALGDAAGYPITAFRAPCFSAEGCDPWFGEALAEAGVGLDSSLRLSRGPVGFRGTLPLAGSGGAVVELPLHALGPGRKRIAVIGGTYLRLLPLPAVLRLLRRAGARGFVPMIYLHPYDVDPGAPALPLPRHRLRSRLGDRMRRTGRRSAAAKVRALARHYEFVPVEQVLP